MISVRQGVTISDFRYCMPAVSDFFVAGVDDMHMQLRAMCRHILARGIKLSFHVGPKVAVVFVAIDKCRVKFVSAIN